MNKIGNRPTAGCILSLHAITSVHWGAGASLGTVDLPIQRERHTQWPNGAGSALKGVLRDACREAILVDNDRKKADNDDRIRRLFGAAKGANREEESAGSLSVTDVRLLAFPVRSLVGVFAWITCPAILDRFRRDLKLAGVTDLPGEDIEPLGQNVIVPKNCPLIVADKFVQLDDETLTVASGDATSLATSLATICLPSSDDYQAARSRFCKQLVVVSDDVFQHFTKYATEIVARIGLNYDTKTVRTGALFYQELLPAESLMYSVALMNSSRNGDTSRSGPELLNQLHELLQATRMLQVGGDETTGKGYCSIHFHAQGN